MSVKQLCICRGRTYQLLASSLPVLKYARRYTVVAPHANTCSYLGWSDKGRAQAVLTRHALCHPFCFARHDRLATERAS